MAAVLSVLSALFVLAFLGGLLMQGEADLQHGLALVSMAVSVPLFYMLLSILGLLQVRALRRRVIGGPAGR